MGRRRYSWLVLLLAGCQRAAPPDLRARGQELFFHAPAAYASQTALACASCHTHEGRLDQALPLGGVKQRYPAFSSRDNCRISLEERIRGCFVRSLNGSPPSDECAEMKALVAYFETMPPAGTSFRLPAQECVPLAQLDREKGHALYEQKCSSCHQSDGQGSPPQFPPLWGPRSFNDGAGLGRVYTLAAFIHEAMPLGAPGSLSLRQSQELAVFIDSQERPHFAGKEHDYAGGHPPADAIYYEGRDRR